MNKMIMLDVGLQDGIEVEKLKRTFMLVPSVFRHLQSNIENICLRVDKNVLADVLVGVVPDTYAIKISL